MRTKLFIQITGRIIIMIIALYSVHTMMACGGGGEESGDIGLPENYDMTAEINGATYMVTEGAVQSYFVIIENSSSNYSFGSEDVGFSFGIDAMEVGDDLSLQIRATISDYHVFAAGSLFDLDADDITYVMGQVSVNGNAYNIEHITIDFDEIDTSSNNSPVQATALIEFNNGADMITLNLDTALQFMHVDTAAE